MYTHSVRFQLKWLRELERERSRPGASAGERASLDLTAADGLDIRRISLTLNLFSSRTASDTLLHTLMQMARTSNASRKILCFFSMTEKEKKYEKCAGREGPARSALETAYQMNGNRKRLVLDGN